MTKDKGKVQNISDALKIFEDWLKNFEFQNLAKENKAYLPLAAVEIFVPLKEKYGVKNELTDSFLEAYKVKAKGDYKNLRTVSSGDGHPTWDIVRNRELKKIWNEFEESRPDLWNSDDLPTEEHLRLILWAYSPEASKIKKNVSNYEEKLGGLKISSDNEQENDDEKSDVKKYSDRKGDKKTYKRKSERASSSSEGVSGSDDESPKKKSKS